MEAHTTALSSLYSCGSIKKVHVLIERKENEFGNISEDRYFTREHTSELMALRSEIIKELIHIDKLARQSQRPSDGRNKAAEDVL